MGGINQCPLEESQSEHWQKATNIIWIIHIESTWYMDGDQQYDLYMDGDQQYDMFFRPLIDDENKLEMEQPL